MQYTSRHHKRHTAQVSHWVSSVRGPSLSMATPAMRSRPGTAVMPCEGHSSWWPGSPRITGARNPPSSSRVGAQASLCGPADCLIIMVGEDGAGVRWKRLTVLSLWPYLPQPGWGGGWPWELVGATLTPPPQDFREEVGRTTASPVLPVLNYSLRHPFLLSKRAGPEGAGEVSATM